MNSSYSPFFTSGFLSHTSWLSASHPHLLQEEQLGPRRGSLPTDNLHPVRASPDIDDASAFYFTLQPSRGVSEYRSYLSLDIAESMSLRTVSNSRRGTVSSDWTFPPIAKQKSMESMTPRQSKESLRVLPSPKPAPSASLPPPPPQSNLSAARPASSSVAPSSERPRTLLSTPTSSIRAGRRAEALAQLEGRSRTTFLTLSDEAEDVVLPSRSSPLSNPLSSFLSFSPLPSPTLSKSISSWLPLSSFMDLGSQDVEREEERWNWRSFIEFGTL